MKQDIELKTVRLLIIGHSSKNQKQYNVPKKN